MAKKPGTQTRFSCSECGFVSVKWLGRCPDCGQWDSLAERRLENRAGLVSVDFHPPGR